MTPEEPEKCSLLSQGVGLIAAPTSINAEIEKNMNETAGMREEAIIRSYVISVQRKTPHPAVRAITEKAGEWLFKENM